MNYKFPFPVLQFNSLDSSYKENYLFEIEYSSSKYVSNFLQVSFFLKVNSVYLVNLVKSNKATYVIKVNSKYYSGIHDVSINSTSGFEINIPTSNLSIFDDINFTMYIVLNDNLTLTYFDELKKEYEALVFNLLANDVLAVSNQEQIFLQQKSDPIFQVSKDPNISLGYKFLIRENYIHILFNPNIYDDYFRFIKKSSGLEKRLMYSKLLTEGFLYVFLEIKKEGYEKLIVKQSIKKIEILFNSIDLESNFEDLFSEGFLSETLINFNKSIELIQKIIDYQFDKVITELGK
jgi:hypothetical protein